jgi:DNA-binding NtrC family response regulator
VRNGEFREDLFYRINEFRLEIPPLRERKRDIPALAARYVAECNATYGYQIDGFTEEATRALLNFDWPGNARRLRAVIKRACAVADSKLLGVEDLDLSSYLKRPAEAASPPANPANLDDWALSTVERRHIERVLRHAGNNKSEAARILGIARTTLDRKLSGYGLDCQD